MRRQISLISGILTALIGLSVILGYLLNNTPLKTFMAVLAMNPMTAIALVLAGVSLCVLVRARPGSALYRLGFVCAGLVAFAGLICLIGRLTGRDVYIDSYLFTSQLEASASITGMANRMYLLTAFNFLLTGSALLIIYAKAKESMSQLLSLGTLILAFVSSTWYFYGLLNIKSQIGGAPMAFETGIAFMIFTIGLLFSRPDRGYMRVIMSESAGGLMMRKLALPLVVTPVLLGFLVDVFHDLDLVANKFWIPVLVTASTIIILAILWRLAYVLEEMDADLLKTKKKLEDSLSTQDNFRQIAEKVDSVFFMTDADKTKFFYASPGYEKIWGRTVESLYRNPRSWFEAVHPEDRERMAKVLAEWGNKEQEEDFRILRPDGTERWVTGRTFLVRDASGKVVRVAGMTHDITDQKSSSEAYKKQNELLERALALTTGRELKMIQLKKEIERLTEENTSLRK